MDTTLDRLAAVLEARKTAATDTSYVAGLYRQGLDAILKKVGEEITEMIIAAKSGQREQIVHETADVWFHTLVMLSHLNLKPAEVLSELDRRFGRSGLEEKAARHQR